MCQPGSGQLLSWRLSVLLRPRAVGARRATTKGSGRHDGRRHDRFRNAGRQRGTGRNGGCGWDHERWRGRGRNNGGRGRNDQPSGSPGKVVPLRVTDAHPERGHRLRCVCERGRDAALRRRVCLLDTSGGTRSRLRSRVFYLPVRLGLHRVSTRLLRASSAGPRNILAHTAASRTTDCAPDQICSCGDPVGRVRLFGLHDGCGLRRRLQVR